MNAPRYTDCTCPYCLTGLGHEGSPDSLRAPGTDIYVEEYVADPFPVRWDVLAAIVIAAACIAFVWWRLG